MNTYLTPVTTMDPTSIRDALLDYIRQEFRRPALSAADPLLEGVIDSIGIFNLVGFIEASFKVSLKEDELTVENFANVDALASLVQKWLSHSEQPS